MRQKRRNFDVSVVTHSLLRRANYQKRRAIDATLTHYLASHDTLS